MSSLVLSASGQRPVNVTLNDPARTGATVGATPSDELYVNVSSVSFVQFLLPVEAKIERIKMGDAEALRVTLGADDGKTYYNQLQVYTKSTPSQFPHAEVDARANRGTTLAGYEAVAVVQDRAGDWIPATAAEAMV